MGKYKGGEFTFHFWNLEQYQRRKAGIDPTFQTPFGKGDKTDLFPRHRCVCLLLDRFVFLVNSLQVMWPCAVAPHL
jgi:hypothetical protein